jgi:hypothetical protein
MLLYHISVENNALGHLDMQEIDMKIAFPSTIPFINSSTTTTIEMKLSMQTIQALSSRF